MANELRTRGQQPGLTVYGLLYSGQQVWRIDTLAFATITDWSSYATRYPIKPISELGGAGTSGAYYGNLPTASGGAALPQGLYGYELRAQQGAAPAITDPVIAAGSVDWDGTKERALNQVALDSSGRVTAASVAGSVGSVAAPVTVGANNDKTGYTVSAVQDKTGYALTSAEHTAIAQSDVPMGVAAAGTLARAAEALPTFDDFRTGDTFSLPVIVPELSNTVISAIGKIYTRRTDASPLASVTAAIANAGVLQADSTYTAQLVLPVTPIQTNLLTVPLAYWLDVVCTLTGGAIQTRRVGLLQPRAA